MAQTKKMTPSQLARRRHTETFGTFQGKGVEEQYMDPMRVAGYYHEWAQGVYKRTIPSGVRVLEMGCSTGALLASLDPAQGVGVDISQKHIAEARKRHPGLTFIEGDAHDVHLGDQQFDYIILSDLVMDLWDVQLVLRNVKRYCHSRTRVIINGYSRLWQLPLSIARRLRLARSTFDRNWLTREDIENLLRLEGFDPIRTWSEMIWPVRTPGLDTLMNRFIARLWPFRHLALSNFVLARPAPEVPGEYSDVRVSVVVAARNEAGNIRSILERTPEIGAGTELIFVEGHSTDDTYDTIAREIQNFPERDVHLYRQSGKGKGDAVRCGFSKATGSVLMILDADMTVPPEDLPRFYEAIRLGRGEFINGVRLVYPMEDDAMRFLNMLGNKFFSLAFTWLIGQPIKDTLCGTKVLSRRDYEAIADNRSYFGEFDPFGDFDLLFGAARLNLKIIDLPVRYASRTYGETNISRWRHGALLLRMVVFAARRLKFV